VKLKEISKARYQKHLNITIAGCIAALLLGALSLSALFIAFVSRPEGDNFMLNLMAVVISIAAIITALSMNRHKPFFDEVYYVWCLKMELNFINAKLHKIEGAGATDDLDALTVLQYYYNASRQLWTLDDNTISIDSLDEKQQRLERRLSQLSKQVASENYRREQLKKW